MNRIKLLSTNLHHFTMGKVAIGRMGRGVCLILTVLLILIVTPFVLYGEDSEKPEIKVQMGHSESILSAVFSPDGKYVLSGSMDNTLKLWDLASGKELRTFKGHKGSINSVAFSPDGKHVLSSSTDRTVRLWDVATGKEKQKYSGYSGDIYSVAFSPNGQYFVSGGFAFANDDHPLKLWDIKTKKEIVTFDLKIKTEYDSIPMEYNLRSVLAVAFSPNGRYILSSALDNFSIIMWDIDTGKAIKTFHGHSGSVDTVSISADSKYFLSGSRDKSVKLWDVATGKELKNFVGHSGTFIYEVAFSPDSVYALSVGSDDKLILWNVITGKEIWKVSGEFNYFQSATFSMDSKNILTTNGNDLKIYNILKRKEVGVFSKHIPAIISGAVSSNGRYILSGYREGLLNLWDLSYCKIVRTFTDHPDSAYFLTFSRNSKFFISKNKHKFMFRDVANGSEIRRSINYSESAKSVAVSPDDKYILTGNKNKTLTLWSIISGKKIREFTGHSASVNSVVFSYDGKYILSGSDDKSLKFWEISSGKCLQTFAGNINYIDSVALSHDGKYALSGSLSSLILWDIVTGEKVREFNGALSFITSITFSPNDKYVLSAGFDKILNIWDVSTGEKIQTFSGHSGIVNSASFIECDKYLWSTSDDGTTRIWNIETGQWVAFMSHSNGKDWQVFDSDGYWDSSRHGGDLVAMVKGMDCWNIDQFAVKNNRPDLILAKLPNADKELISEYNRQYKKRIAKLEKLYGIKETDLSSDLHVPKAEILKSEQKGKNLTLSIKLEDTKYNLVSYNIYINDVPVYAEIGKKIKRDNKLTVNETIELSAGENKIEVSCFNEKGAESYRTLTYSVHNSKPEGDLYFIGFGNNEYNDPSISDLKYAEKDVLDLSNKFSKMNNDYGRIHIKTYTGSEVTPENIKAAKEFVKNASVDDTVILFISGHGMHDSDEFKTYYYLTQNTDMKNLKGTAADFETVEDILAGINPRKKLFLMDTCDSGELDDYSGKPVMIASGSKGARPRSVKGMAIEFPENRGYFDRGRYIYNDLFRRTGAIVFSSSKGGEASWEFDTLKNGAFTRSIIEALSGEGDKDSNGMVTVDELHDYVSKGVVKYTDDKQHPVIDRDNLSIDLKFPVAE